MKRPVAWLIGAALLAAGWVVIQITPDEEIAEAPFVVNADIGELAVGRSIAATVTDARLGDRAVADGWFADGTWLVIDLEAEARGSDALLGSANLVVDGVTYGASERPDSLLKTGLAAGLPRVGSLAFELPAEAAGSPATLQLSADGETRLDSLLEIPLDLGALEREREVALRTEGWAP